MLWADAVRIIALVSASLEVDDTVRQVQDTILSVDVVMHLNCNDCLTDHHCMTLTIDLLLSRI